MYRILYIQVNQEDKQNTEYVLHKVQLDHVNNISTINFGSAESNSPGNN